VAERTSEQDRERVTRGLSVRAASWLAWSLAGLSVVLFVADATLYALARSAPVPDGWDVNFDIAGLLASGIFLTFPVVGALIASRHPRNPVGWILLADGLLWTTTDMLDNYSVYGMARPGSLPSRSGPPRSTTGCGCPQSGSWPPTCSSPSPTAGVTNKEIEQQASSLEGATMPNGQKYEDWRGGWR
jgi:hypothetical protein